MSLKFFRLGSASPHYGLPITSGMFWLSTLVFSILTTFGALPGLAMPFQEQAVETVPMPAIVAIIPPHPALGVAGETHPAIKMPANEVNVASPVIVIGFLGGRVKRGNAVHREVQLAMRLRQIYSAGVYAQVFQNSHGDKALQEIQRLLDVNHDGAISPAEKRDARIIIYGHSWGASETVTMARQLQSDGIPVLLTILVDRVSKVGSGNPRIPANVAQAVNFYQLNGLLHGRRTIRAADPASTQIIGNYQFDYKDTHVSCDEYPWYARLFMGPHIEIENDPRVWNQVESLIRAKLPQGAVTTTATLTSPLP